MSSVSTTGGVRAWDPRTGRWQTPSSAPSSHGPYVVVDSWLVDGGQVRGLDRHRERFTAAVAAAEACGRRDAQRFFDAAVAQLPRTGRWFPRVQLGRGLTAELSLRVRPAPPRLDGVVVLACAQADARTAPRVKGPDLAWQAGVRAAAGVDVRGEVLLAGTNGTVTEGVWSTLLWWEGETLCALPACAPVLDSVTRALVLELARDAGVRVRRAAPTVTHLRASETWLVNALHGIRPVTGWRSAEGSAPDGAPVTAGRAAAWQTRLEALAVPLG